MNCFQLIRSSQAKNIWEFLRRCLSLAVLLLCFFSSFSSSLSLSHSLTSSSCCASNKVKKHFHWYFHTQLTVEIFDSSRRLFVIEGERCTRFDTTLRKMWDYHSTSERRDQAELLRWIWAIPTKKKMRREVKKSSRCFRQWLESVDRTIVHSTPEVDA